MSHPYLESRIVEAKPVEAGNRWKGIVSNYKEKEKDPFLFKKIVKSYEVPLNPASKGGGVVVILDNSKKHPCPDIIENGKIQSLTEQEYFEKILGKSLNPYLPAESNFWRSDSRARVQIRDAKIRLNLENPMDMLKYKILKSNETRFAPSIQSLKTLKRASYEFVFTSIEEERNDTLSRLEFEAKAYELFTKVCKSDRDMRDFLRVAGKNPTQTANTQQLKAMVGKVMEEDKQVFIQIVSDPLYESKLFIAEAKRLGALKEFRGKYTLDTGAEIGDIRDAINFLNREENQEIKIRIQALVDANREVEA
jgi:hypothetical protein